MKCLNRVSLMGRIAADFELKKSKTGKSVVNFPLAVSKVVSTNEGKSEGVDFFRIIAWGSLADICSKYLEKGGPVYVEGKISNYSFEDANKQKHFRTEIVADDVHFLSFAKKDEVLKAAKS